MDFLQFWKRIGGTDGTAEDAAWGWEESQACYPSEGPFFLNHEQLACLCAEVDFGADRLELFRCCARMIRADEELSRLAWHGYWRLFVAAECHPLRDWPSMVQLGELNGVFYALIALGSIPRILQYHGKLGLPASTTRETLQQIKIYADINYTRGNNGRFGVYQSQLNWLHLYPISPLLRVGRFEYCLQPNPNEIYVYRNINTGETIAFPPAEMKFDKDGYAYRNPEDYHGETWLSEYAEKDGSVTGTPVSPLGHAENRRITLPLNEWKLVVSPGTFCLSMHIPAGGGMTMEKCRDSLIRARTFFATYFPDKPAKAVVCFSWIFNPQLPQILGEEANLVRFQKELYLFPRPSGNQDGLWFIFLNSKELDLRTAPRETRLERQVLDYIGNGGTWRVGGMFLLLEDIDAFGTHPYRAKH